MLDTEVMCGERVVEEGDTAGSGVYKGRRWSQRGGSKAVA